jgi:hypothetical protein
LSHAIRRRRKRALTHAVDREGTRSFGAVGPVAGHVQAWWGEAQLQPVSRARADERACNGAFIGWFECGARNVPVLDFSANLQRKREEEQLAGDSR